MIRAKLPKQKAVATGRLDFSQRTLRLTHSRTLGNRILKRTRQRETGSDTERDWVG